MTSSSRILTNMATVEEVSATLDKNMPTQDVEAQLDDDKQVQPADFKGATLQLGHGDALSAPPEVEFEGAGLKRDRPGSAISRKSVSSISSRTSVNNKFVRSKLLAKNFFCRRVIPLLLLLNLVHLDLFSVIFEGIIYCILISYIA